MFVTIKNLKSQTFQLEVEPDILLQELHDQACEKFGFENARLIYSGHIMNLTEKLSQYMKETDRGFIVVMKKYTPISETNPVSETNQGEQRFTLQQVNAAIIGILRFISTNQLLNYTYFTSPIEFYNIMRTPTFTDIIQQILDNSNEIANTIASNSDMNIELEIPTATTETNYTNINGGTNQEIRENLSEEDLTNIDTLVNLGYTANEAFTAYMMAGKNVNLAATLLLDM